MRLFSAYAYAAAGPGESTTDLAWDGHGVIYENGALLGETARFSAQPTFALADIDLAAEQRDAAVRRDGEVAVDRIGRDGARTGAGRARQAEADDEAGEAQPGKTEQRGAAAEMGHLTPPPRAGWRRRRTWD